MDTITYWCVKYVITENGGAGNRVKGKGLNITTRSCFKSIISNPHGVRCMFSWAWGSAEQNASLMPVLIKVFDHKYFYGLSVQLLQQFWQRSSCSYQHLSPHITQCVQSFYLLSLVDYGYGYMTSHPCLCHVCDTVIIVRWEKTGNYEWAIVFVLWAVLVSCFTESKLETSTQLVLTC